MNAFTLLRKLTKNLDLSPSASFSGRPVLQYHITHIPVPVGPMIIILLFSSFSVFLVKSKLDPTVLLAVLFGCCWCCWVPGAGPRGLLAWRAAVKLYHCIKHMKQNVKRNCDFVIQHISNIQSLNYYTLKKLWTIVNPRRHTSHSTGRRPWKA